MGFTFGVIVNYVLSILVVFKDVEDKKRVALSWGFIIFVALGTIGFLINLAIKEVGNMILAFEGNFFWFAFVFAFATLIVLIYNYISRKLILFRPSKKRGRYQVMKSTWLKIKEG